MNKNAINNAICYYLNEFRNYDDSDDKLNETVHGLIGNYCATEKKLSDKLTELKDKLHSIVEPRRINATLSKNLSDDQLNTINSLESRDENSNYYIDIKKLIESKLEYMKSNVGKNTDEIQAIDNIVNEITSLYASNIESLAKIIERKKEYNEALINYISQLKFTIMAYVKHFDTNTTVIGMKEVRDRKNHFIELNKILLNKITELLEDAEFHESFRSQTEEDIKLLEQTYSSNIDSLYKVKMSYDYLLFEAYDLYNANAAIKANATIKDISRNVPDYDTQDFVADDDVEKKPKTDPKTINEDSLKISIERTVRILNNSYATIGKTRKISSDLSSILDATNDEKNESKSMIKLVMHNGQALEPINK